MHDRIERITLSLTFLPLKSPVSDAKVATGRQKPLTEVAFLFAEIDSADGHSGLGFSYSKRAGGPGLFAHAREIAPTLLGEDPSDIARLWNKLMWAGASVGRSGLATQAIAAFDNALWDLKGKRAGLSIAKLLGAIAIRCSVTTLPAGSSRPRSGKCSITSIARSPRASAASRSRSDSPTSRQTWPGWKLSPGI